MNNRQVCISKKATFVFVILFLLVAYVLIVFQTLTTGTSTNSRAEDTKQTTQSKLLSPPPTDLQQTMAIKYKALINNSGDIELLGKSPVVSGTPTYAIYMKKPDGSFVHIDTFVTTSEELKKKFTGFWTPQVKVSIEEIKTADFLLYEIQ